MRLARGPCLEDLERILELTDTVAKLENFVMQLFGVGEDKPIETVLTGDPGNPGNQGRG